jgi:hypothetical protein
MPCQLCGTVGPTKVVHFQQNIGMLAARKSAKIDGELCRPCIGRVFRSYTFTTLVLGWWGTISFVLTPFILISNLIQYFRSLSLAEPGISAMDRPIAATPPRLAGAVPFKINIMVGAILLSIGLAIFAFRHVEAMEKIAPNLNAALHQGQITDEADGEYVGIQIWKDIGALEADIKSKAWSDIRKELLAREPSLSDFNAQNNKLQDRLVVERNENLGAGDVCENLALTEMGPALKDYGVAINEMFTFVKSTPRLTSEKTTALDALADRESSAVKALQEYTQHNRSSGCNK